MRHLLLCLAWLSGSLLFAQTAETLSFHTDYSTVNLGTTLYDSQSYASDITDLDVVVFNASSADEASAGTSTGSLVFFKGNTINTSEDYLCQISPSTGVEDDGDYNYPQYLVITTQDKRPFSFQGLSVGDFIGAERTIIAEAFYCGKSKGSVTLTMDDLYEKSFGTETFTEPIFGMVDEVRFSRGDTDFTGHLAGFNNFRLAANAETVTISNTAEWDEFASRVNDGEAYINGILANDISVSTTIGTGGSYVFKGNFDGQGNTITFDGEGRTADYVGPFGALNEAYIHDLHVAGSIRMAASVAFVGAIASLNGGKAERVTSSLKIDDGSYACNHVGGVVGHLEGLGIVEKCAFDGTISALQSGDCVAGVVGYSAIGKIDNCLNAGTITAPDAVGGILGYISNYAFEGLTNCLNVGSVSGGSKRGAIIGYFRSTVPTSNNYYLEGSCDYISYDKTAKAEVVTAARLKNGEVMGLLGSAWTQQWGTDAHPSPFTDAVAGKKNQIYFDDSKGWTCDVFEISDAITLPVGIDFTASQASYLRDFTADATHAKTICLPFSVELDDSFELYVFEQTTPEGIFRFVQKDDGIIAPNTPYLLLSKESRTSLTTQNAQVEKDAVNDHVFLIPGIDGTFWGTNTGLTATEAAEKNAYTLGTDNRWYRCADHNGYVSPHRAYICGGDSQAKAFTTVLDAETTLIDAVGRDADGREIHRYYGLTGRYLGTDLRKVPRGVYIDNSQKKVKR